MITQEMIAKAAEYISEDSESYLMSKYSQGREIGEALENQDFLPNDFLMWLLHGAHLSDKSTELIKERLCIRDSKAFFQSHHLDSCAKISYSSYCQGSRKISHSADIEGSLEVHDSQDVVDSAYIRRGEDIRSSKYIIGSAGIDGSIGVNNSKQVRSSALVETGERVRNSFFIVNSKDIDFSILSRDLDQASHKIFCEGLTHSSDPMIFNEKVSDRIFFRVYEELKSLILREQERSGLDWWTGTQRYRYNYSSALFIGLPNKETFWMQVKSIVPNYNPELAYKISHNRYTLSDMVR